MADDITEKHAQFFDSDFQRDLSRLGELTQDAVNAIKDWLQTLDSMQDILEDEKWVPLARTTDKNVDELQTLLKPVLWIAFRAQEESVSAKDIVEQLVENELVETDDVRNALDLLLPLAVSLVQKTQEVSTPDLPLLRIQSLSTRCALLPTFDKDFDLRHDNIGDYDPNVERLLPSVCLEIKFDKRDEPIGIQLTPENLETLRTWLDYAESQLQAIREHIEDRNVIGESSGDERNE